MHHNGDIPDDAARQRYRQLQGNLARTLANGQTPDEARVPDEADGSEQRGLVPPGEGKTDQPDGPETAGLEKDKLWRPTTRAELDADLLAKGFRKADDDKSSSGYLVYKHIDGRRVTVKPSGEVIPVKPTLSNKSKPYRERTNYEFVRLPDQSHSTGHFVEPIDENDSKDE